MIIDLKTFNKKELKELEKSFLYRLEKAEQVGIFDSCNDIQLYYLARLVQIYRFTNNTKKAAEFTKKYFKRLAYIAD